MATTFDDGSTIDYDTGQSTPAPAGMLLSDYSSNIIPGNATSGASSWADVLKYGFGRVVDYKIATLTPQNTQPTYAPQNLAYQGQGNSLGINPQTIMLAGAVFLGVALLRSFMKKRKG